MVGATQQLHPEQLNPDKFAYDLPNAVFLLLKGIYLEERERFNELLGFVIDKLNLVVTEEITDLDGNRLQKVNRQDEKIAALNRFLSIST